MKALFIATMLIILPSFWGGSEMGLFAQYFGGTNDGFIISPICNTGLNGGTTGITLNAISGPATVCTDNTATFSISLATGAATVFNWIAPANATMLMQQNEQSPIPPLSNMRSSAKFRFATAFAGGNINIEVYNSCGMVASAPFAVAPVACLVYKGGVNDGFATATLASTPLPIELLRFTATPIDNKYVRTEWITVSETNNDYFTVEKTKDAIGYEFVGQVDGAGNSNSTLSYQLIDTDPYPGASYYRLKQTDFNGAYTYSQLVPVNLNGIDIINIYPNPAHDEFEYIIGSTEKTSVQIKVVDILGRIVINKTENIEKGVTSKSLNVSELSSGTYILELITENKEVRGKQFQIR